jgi:hypothetical protein
MPFSQTTTLGTGHGLIVGPITSTSSFVSQKSTLWSSRYGCTKFFKEEDVPIYSVFPCFAIFSGHRAWPHSRPYYKHIKLCFTKIHCVVIKLWLYKVFPRRKCAHLHCFSLFMPFSQTSTLGTGHGLILGPITSTSSFVSQKSTLWSSRYGLPKFFQEEEDVSIFSVFPCFAIFSNNHLGHMAYPHSRPYYKHIKLCFTKIHFVVIKLRLYKVFPRRKCAHLHCFSLFMPFSQTTTLSTGHGLIVGPITSTSSFVSQKSTLWSSRYGLPKFFQEEKDVSIFSVFPCFAIFSNNHLGHRAWPHSRPYYKHIKLCFTNIHFVVIKIWVSKGFLRRKCAHLHCFSLFMPFSQTTTLGTGHGLIVGPITSTSSFVSQKSTVWSSRYGLPKLFQEEEDVSIYTVFPCFAIFSNNHLGHRAWPHSRPYYKHIKLCFTKIHFVVIKLWLYKVFPRRKCAHLHCFSLFMPFSQTTTLGTGHGLIVGPITSTSSFVSQKSTLWSSRYGLPKFFQEEEDVSIFSVFPCFAIFSNNHLGHRAWPHSRPYYKHIKLCFTNIHFVVIKIWVSKGFLIRTRCAHFHWFSMFLSFSQTATLCTWHGLIVGLITGTSSLVSQTSTVWSSAHGFPKFFKEEEDVPIFSGFPCFLIFSDNQPGHMTWPHSGPD